MMQEDLLQRTLFVDMQSTFVVLLNLRSVGGSVHSTAVTVKSFRVFH